MKSEVKNYSSIFSNEIYTIIGTFDSRISMWKNDDVKITVKNRERMKKMELYTEKARVYYGNLQGKKKKKKKNKLKRGNA